MAVAAQSPSEHGGSTEDTADGGRTQPDTGGPGRSSRDDRGGIGIVALAGIGGSSRRGGRGRVSAVGRAAGGRRGVAAVAGRGEHGVDVAGHARDLVLGDAVRGYVKQDFAVGITEAKD